MKSLTLLPNSTFKQVAFIDPGMPESAPMCWAATISQILHEQEQQKTIDQNWLRQQYLKRKSKTSFVLHGSSLLSTPQAAKQNSTTGGQSKGSAYRLVMAVGKHTKKRK